ncbi:MAG: PEP-CTERM sorting domain-containing protein [Fimbriimonadaceae bacterium]|nr:PEP-CTERM sorting domain-containing protein [Fimbriimonadaceae bacterium]
MTHRIHRILALALTLVTAAVAPAQLLISNLTYAQAYDPAWDQDWELIPTWADWQSAGQVSSVFSTSESHPWDPPINIATASSAFTQPSNLGDATLRAISFVLSDYSGTGSSLGYEAKSTFVLSQNVAVRTGYLPGFLVNMQLAVPMHGLLAASGGTSANGSASAGLDVSVFDAGGALLDGSSADLQVDGNGFGAFTWSATGDWAGDVQETTLQLPTGEARSGAGVELNSFDILDLGWIPTDTVLNFQVLYRLETSAVIPSPDGLMAIADFSGTGGFEFRALDQNGNPFTDFQVLPVPEPSTLVAFGLGALALKRRGRAAPVTSSSPNTSA